jgi:protein RecA
MKPKFNKIYKKDYYYLDISGDDARIFIEEISFILNDKIDKIKSVGYRQNSKSNKWNFPYQNNLIRALYKDIEYGSRARGRLIEHILDDKRNQKLSNDKLNEIIQHFSTLDKGVTATIILEHLNELKNYICDEVISSEEVSSVPVFDVVMPKTHTFVSNGFISHNTTLTMSVIAEAQKRGLTCAFVDAEHAADPDLFKAMGVDITKLLTVKAFIGDENLDALEMLLKTKDGIDVAVVDSVSALIPKKEAMGEVGDDYVAELARLMSKATRKFVPIIAETNTLLIFINQIRNKIGVYGDPSTTSGGMALDFYATGRIRVEGGEFQSSRIVEKESGEVIGHKTKFKIVKNKLAVPFKTAEIPLIYGVGYDIVSELFDLAVDLGFIDANGAWYYINGEKIGQGEKNALEYLREHKDVYENLRNEVIEITGLKEYYEHNSGAGSEDTEDGVSE